MCAINNNGKNNNNAGLTRFFFSSLLLLLLSCTKQLVFLNKLLVYYYETLKNILTGKPKNINKFLKKNLIRFDTRMSRFLLDRRFCFEEIKFERLRV
jgi:hypothetical protein